MTKIGHLYRADWNNLENSAAQAYTCERLATFVPESNLTAYGKATKFLNDLPPIRPYLGWDQEIYPQFKYKEEDGL